MSSNLNKAFLRAYAKDGGRSTADAASVPAENAQTPAPALGRQPARGSMPGQFVSSHPVQPQLAQPRPTSEAPIAGPHFRTTVAGHAPAAASRPTEHSAPDAELTAADAASVWQRIDVAQSLQQPHVSPRQSRPVAAGVGVGTASGPKRMQAGASAPAAPQARSVELGRPQPADLPLLSEEASAAASDPQSVETRRRTVADFLYSAGKVSGTASSPMRPVVAQTSQVEAPIHPMARPANMSPAIPTAMPPSRASASVTAMPATQNASMLGGQRSSNSTVDRLYAPVASAVQNPLHAVSAAATSAPAYTPVHGPAKYTQPAAAPAPANSPSAQPTSKRMGQILRVDTTPHVRQSDSGANREAAAPPAADPRSYPAAQPVANAATLPSHAAGHVAGEQRRIDRAHELTEAEQKLRRATHKIFNPVWEVDTLQWPTVCDKLMEHRAESMAQVAAHLKAACQDGLNILGVTSPSSGEGRTTVACCLARLAAAHGLNVALIDLDLDHPTLCLQTNLEVEHDWRDCLTGDIALEEVAVHSIDDQLTLLPLKDRSDRPDLLASDMGIADVLRELSESFELVIVDACRMSSAGNVINGLAAAQAFDAAIVVVDRRNSHQERIEDAVRALQQTGVGSIGIVDNFSM